MTLEHRAPGKLSKVLKVRGGCSTFEQLARGKSSKLLKVRAGCWSFQQAARSSSCVLEESQQANQASSRLFELRQCRSTFEQLARGKPSFVRAARASGRLLKLRAGCSSFEQAARASSSLLLRVNLLLGWPHQLMKGSDGQKPLGSMYCGTLSASLQGSSLG